MAKFFEKSGDRFRELDQEEIEKPGVKPWLGIEFKEMGGLSVSKTYVTDGDDTYEVFKAPLLSGGPYAWQIHQEVTPMTHPFLYQLIQDEMGKL
jgi:hypothetical protein